MMSRLLFGALALAGLTACGTYGLNGLDGGTGGAPRAKVDPEIELSFPMTSWAGAAGEGDVTVYSVGEAPLAIEAVGVSGLDERMFYIGELPLPMMLQPGRDFPIKVYFLPEAQGSFRAQLDITTGNEGTAVLSRSLVGEGCRDFNGDGSCENGGPPPLDTGDTGG